MKSQFFRQQITRIVLMAVSIMAIAPLGAGCCCESRGSHCPIGHDADMSTGHSMNPDHAGSCCDKPFGKKCCGCKQPENECRCGTQRIDVASPETVLSIQKPSFARTWGVAPLDDWVGDRAWSVLLAYQYRRQSRALQVPLRILLCVFLN